MFVSVFDVFKISVGPSSSHTMGPMLAARRFVESVVADFLEGQRVAVTLYGSLAYTGIGHGTNRAVWAGLLGFEPETYDRRAVDAAIGDLEENGRFEVLPGRAVAHDPRSDLILDKSTRLETHPNGMRFALLDPDGTVLAEETYFSIGGGFVVTAAGLDAGEGPADSAADTPYPFATAAQMVAMSETSGFTVAEMKRANECARLESGQYTERLRHIWSVMDACIERGLEATGELPGGLKVSRRAKAIAEQLDLNTGKNDLPLHSAIDWLSAYAMAVNEENAAGGQVVTAPTNGAAGVFPAVLRYYLRHVPGASEDKIPDMLLTGAAIGGLIKFNASISGAEVGCQGEVGSASAMAAAALCSALGGSTRQIENAAEIALEHHLGMTCDPIRGLVQVPCIERNGLGAVKAVAAASLALRGDGKHIVPLDACIATMLQTGRDMDSRYKETSLGGLSVAVPDC